MKPSIAFLFCALAPLAAFAATTDGAPVTPPGHAKVTQLATVKVTAKRRLANSNGTRLAVYGDASVHDTPAAISVIGRQQIDASQIQSLANLPRLDASLGDDYAPVGYIQNLTIRGYPLDLATGYRINGLTVTGEQYIPFEGKQEVQILQGLAGIASGVMEPGGVINYVTERPTNVQSVSLGTDSHGSRYGAVDFGRWLTPNFGVRVNAVSAGMHSYVDHADGHRHFYSLAADWAISPRALLELDTDYLGYAQMSVSGYQLLGGATLPQHVDRTQLLGYEPWQQPTTDRSDNTSARLTLALAPGWTARIALGHSRSFVLDNVAYAYGCTGSPACVTGPMPSAWFATNGDYAVWDYRSPDETYVDDEGRGTIEGRFGQGLFRQDVTFGVDVLHHTVALPNAVFDQVGIANISQHNPPVFAPSPSMPGPVTPRENSYEHTLFALDRWHIGDHWQLAAGGHFVRLDERSWDGNSNPQPQVDMVKLLPQAALLWLPTSALTAYLSYSKGLSLGQQAPYWATNAGDTLAPRLSRQTEAGVKYRWNPRLNLTAALYRIHQPYQFAIPNADGSSFTFIQRGEEVHTGLELGLHGQVTDDLRVDASVALIQARAQNTGVALYEGHQVMNVPRARGTLQVDYRLPSAPALSLLAGWQYASPNAATPDGRLRVAAYNVFDAGLAYRQTWAGRPVLWRLGIDNITNHFYWRYTGSTGGDSYLLPGAPRLVRLSVKVSL